MSRPLACCADNLVLVYQEIGEADFSWIWRCPHCGYWHYATEGEIERERSSRELSQEEIDEQGPDDDCERISDMSISEDHQGGY